ncbi:hypothetical protein [Loktanella sp. M215]|uniref:hypothetical protein n=1 Tax=Loktanella sp. M215 TaxID=2675431 RepID=UPI001F45BB64|nr:hypothetical protein [Loktanella sp. M215]MCF7700784.1 hypothetical protein [Loktanella sp. M215]
MAEGNAIPADPGPIDSRLAGNVRLRSDKRPRPLVLRVNVGDCLRVTFTNLLSPVLDGEEILTDPQTGRLIPEDSDEPATRSASLRVTGLDLAGDIGSDGGNIGLNPSSLAAPGETRTYIWHASAEGAFLIYSGGAMAGGEGDGGQLGLGLFGAVNVEPAGSVWYRSQVTASQMQDSTLGTNAMGTPRIDYTSRTADGLPVLNILDERDPMHREIVHSDLNAIIVPGAGNCSGREGPGTSCDQAFREFTVIFHDEITAVQAFAELDREDSPMHALRDGMGINYGAAGLGAMVLANRKGIGPARNCAECKLEEFFLTSWAMGDPALVVERDADNQPLRAIYEDDPSNVHHSYLGDPVRFRNLHAGPKETHVFHLHAHQWVQDRNDDNSIYLDSQTISPGATFDYDVHYGGAGNRNMTVGDSIFHCHLYPHFAQGMWELWRTHDVFEAGTRDRWLPDGEITGGTPNPAVVPLPDAAMPPMPTDAMKGYPFYIAGIPGHRPPQPPLDIDPAGYAGDPSETLMRHVVVSGEREIGGALFGPEADGSPKELAKKYLDASVPEDAPNGQSNRIANRVHRENSDDGLLVLAAKLTSAQISQLPSDGTPAEQRAMAYHAGAAPGAVPIAASDYGVPEVGYPSCRPDGTCDSPDEKVLFRVNGLAPKPGAPFADPCPARYFDGEDDRKWDPTYWHDLTPDRRYRAAYIQFDMPVNKHGWHDPQARILTLEEDAKATLDHTRTPEPLFMRANSGDCIRFEATNLIPSNLNLDDFQVFTPTDTIGQHIHLVKFDVTSSDGSGNGWNYEDGTFSPDELRERMIAFNHFMGATVVKPLTHRLFAPGGPMAGDPRGICPDDIPADPHAAEALLMDHPWCGAQTTVQRWWADPLLNREGKDRTLRTVFTHDHFGPSSHQQHGFYGALVIEPKDSRWETLGGEVMGGRHPDGTQITVRPDGGPTSFAANIVNPLLPEDPQFNRREYNLAVADFALLYTAPPENKPVGPPARLDHDLPDVTYDASVPMPEGISVSDPGGQLLNYRNEPVPLRVGSPSGLRGKWEQRSFSAGVLKACEASLRGSREVQTACFASADSAASVACENAYIARRCDAGDLSNVFSSLTHADEEDGIRAQIAQRDRAYDTAAIFLDTYLAPCADSQMTPCSEPAGLRNPGDPATPILAANEGDRVMVRLIQGAQEENHIFFMNGAKWLAEPGSSNSGWRSAQHIGISEHFEFEISVENPTPNLPVDHLYGTSATDNLWDGQWGLMRVLGWKAPLAALDRLSSNPFPETGLVYNGNICPESAPLRTFSVEAWRVRDLPGAGRLVYSTDTGASDANAVVYVITQETLDAGDGEKVLRGVAPGQTSGLDTSEFGLLKGGKAIEPLILRANAGDCINVDLWNRVPDVPEDITDPKTWSWNMMPPIVDGFGFNQVAAATTVGLSPQLVALSAVQSDGATVGLNVPTVAFSCPPTGSVEGLVCQCPLEQAGPDYKACYRTAGDSDEIALQPGQFRWTNKRTLTWYAGDFGTTPSQQDRLARPIEFGVIGLRDLADPIKASSHGTAGVLVIEPENATWETDCDILRDAGQGTAPCLTAAATVTTPDAVPFREFVLMYGNDASMSYRGQPLANLRNGDDAEDSGQKTFNYAFEPFWTRIGANPAADPDDMADVDYTNVLSSKPSDGYGDPETPLFTATAGTPVRLRVVHPAGHPRNSGFELAGHGWVSQPYAQDSTVQSADPDRQHVEGVVNGMGPGRGVNILLPSAGGQSEIAGDYLYRSHEGFAFSGGQWGLMRVLPKDACAVGSRTTSDALGRNVVCN